MLGDEAPDGDFEAEGFGPGGQVVPPERQELAAEALKSFHLENLAAFESTRGRHKSVIQCSAMPQNNLFIWRSF